MSKYLDVLAVIHFGNYVDEGSGASRVVDDNCPCCGWSPDMKAGDEQDFRLGEMWNPKTGKAGMGCLFQILHCQQCGIVYATHIN